MWELGERALISLCMQVERQAGPAGEGFSAARSQLSLEGLASRQQQRECGLCWLPGLDGQAATVRSGPIQRRTLGPGGGGLGQLWDPQHLWRPPTLSHCSFFSSRVGPLGHGLFLDSFFPQGHGDA